jgi:hypothetical protein
MSMVNSGRSLYQAEWRELFVVHPAKGELWGTVDADLVAVTVDRANVVVAGLYQWRGSCDAGNCLHIGEGRDLYLGRAAKLAVWPELKVGPRNNLIAEIAKRRTKTVSKYKRGNNKGNTQHHRKRGEGKAGAVGADVAERESNHRGQPSFRM